MSSEETVVLATRWKAVHFKIGNLDKAVVCVSETCVPENEVTEGLNTVINVMEAAVPPTEQEQKDVQIMQTQKEWGGGGKR